MGSKTGDIQLVAFNAEDKLIIGSFSLIVGSRLLEVERLSRTE